MSVQPFPDMSELVQRLLDDQIEPDEMKRLQEAMLKDPQARRYYLDSMFACAVMRRRRPRAGELSESDLIQTLSGGRNQGGSKRVVRYVYSMAAVLVFGVMVLTSVILFRHKDQGLAIGTFTINVSPQARGFRVRTPTALITDLGTEFGVIAHSDGSTEAHVLKGHIDITLDPNRSGRTTSLVVNEGLAAVVDGAGQTIRGGLAAQADFFLLQLPSASQPSDPTKRLNLADIVGGGDGHGTGTLDRGIDFGDRPSIRRACYRDSAGPTERIPAGAAVPRC